ncbi:hypothetical protein FA15DRAFT_754494 [Coprinopsis marcescibilis]|uniref:Uncharacterized protein n=1 Tax=Coprinopsis marcescibilis TaxID=230819 RepID=A0A5C3L370_COPMA|nr:hypothetical protein FA15DRAFT_754494 [Coprinopsis marcescibilis]
MLRTQVVRTTRNSRQLVPSSLFAAKLVRTYAVDSKYPPPPGDVPDPLPRPVKQGNSNAFLYGGLGLAGGALAYFYFMSGKKDSVSLDKKKQHDEERLRVNARDTVDAAKERARDTLQSGKERVDHVQANARETYDSARSRAERTKQDVEQEARGLFDKAGEKIDSAKQTTKDSLLRARDSTEDLYHDARNTTERKASELRSDADRKSSEFRNDASRKTSELRNDAERTGEEVKEGWFSWLGAGKNKVNEGEDALREGRDKFESEADRLKRQAAGKVANVAEDVRVKADKHT